MSIQFPSDNNAPPRRKGGGMIFLLLFIGVAFFVLRGSGNSNPPTDPGSVDQDSYSDIELPRAKSPESDIFDSANKNANSTKSKDRATKGDWAMEDGPTQRNGRLPANTSKPNETVRNGDWSFDDVATKKVSKKNSNSSGDWGLDLGTKSKTSSTPKKTKKGDWSFEEIDN